MTIRRQIEGVLWKSRFWRKWASISYLHRYGHTYRELLAMYRRSVESYAAGDTHFMGWPKRDVSDMYKESADIRYRREWGD